MSDGCAELWGAVIDQMRRDTRLLALEIPEYPREGERMRPFYLRRQKAIRDRRLGLEAATWFKSRHFQQICALCGADPENVLDLLRKDGMSA